MVADDQTELGMRGTGISVRAPPDAYQSAASVDRAEDVRKMQSSFAAAGLAEAPRVGSRRCQPYPCQRNPMTGCVGRNPKAPGVVSVVTLAAIRKLLEQEMPRIGRGSVVAIGGEQGRSNPLRYTRPVAAGRRRLSRAACKSPAIIHLVSNLTTRASARVAVLRDLRPEVHTLICGRLLERVESLLNQRVTLHGIYCLLEELFLGLLKCIS